MLINRRMVTARDLADHFGVSIRTIYRDIAVISEAGIPVVPVQGIGGGYSLIPGFHLTRQCLSLRDMAAVLSALNGVKSTFFDKSADAAIEKIKSLVPDEHQERLERLSSRVVFDMTPWGFRDDQRALLATLRQAIEECRAVSFTYKNFQHQFSTRTVEPVTITCKLTTWYLFGWCRLRKEARLFRLSRIRDLSLLDETFAPHTDLTPSFPVSWNDPSGAQVVKVTIKAQPEARLIMEDYLEERDFVDQPDGTAIITLEAPDSPWLYGMLLGYADTIEVLGPPEVRSRIRHLLKKTSGRYET